LKGKEMVYRNWEGPRKTCVRTIVKRAMF